MDINSKDTHLTTPLNVNNANNAQNVPISELYSSKKNKMVIKPCTLGHCLVIDIMIIAIVGFIVCLQMNNIREGFIFLSVGIILSLLILICLFTRVEIIKDIPNKRIIFVKKNIYGCRKNETVFNEKIHFYYTSYSRDTDDGTIEDDYFFAINDFKDVTFDLNIVNQKPIKLFTYYTTWKFAANINNLNHFVGSPINYDNPLTFDIIKYMKKNKIESNPFYTFGPTNRQLSKIMKFNEYLFTYNIRLPHCEKNKDIDMDRNRIDFVFSENYDEIFIGIVKANKTSYEKTFRYKMNIIDKFLIKMGYTNEIDLLIAFKNTSQVHHICRIKNILKIDADGIIYLLNEKLNINKENTNTISNFNNEVTPNIY